MSAPTGYENTPKAIVAYLHEGAVRAFQALAPEWPALLSLLPDLAESQIDEIRLRAAGNGEWDFMISFRSVVDEKVHSVFRTFDTDDLARAFAEAESNTKSLPVFPDIGCDGDCGFVGAGIGYQCLDGSSSWRTCPALLSPA